MKFTPYPAFRKVVVLAEATAGDLRDVKLGDDGLVTSGHYFFTKGRACIKVKETGEILQDRIPGWLNLDHIDANASSKGTLELSFPEDTEWLCIPHKHNPSGLPSVRTLITNENEKITAPQGTNIYLVRGVYDINGKIFTGPTQIRVRSGDVEITSLIVEKSYALIFE